MSFDEFFAKNTDTPVKDMEETLNNLNKAETSYYRKKWYEKACFLWEFHEEVKKLWERVETRLLKNRFVRKAVEIVSAITEKVSRKDRIEWNGIKPMGDGVEQCYLIRLLDEDKNLIWSKVGTTTKKTEQRMKQHLSYYKDKGVKYVEILRLWDCGSAAAEEFESKFRGFYLGKFGKEAYVKNDRFKDVEFDLAEADQKFEEFMLKE